MIQRYEAISKTFLTLAFAATLLAACGQSEPGNGGSTEGSAKVPITTSSDAARELYHRGRDLSDDLLFVEANELFTEAVAEDPDFAMGWYQKAITSLTAAEFFDATEQAKQCAELASEGEQLYIKALAAAADNDQALQRQATEALMGKFPQDERTHMLMGNFLNGQQDFKGAVEHYSHATAINPKFASAYNALGYAHRSLDDLGSAQQAFAKYVDLLPDTANPYDSLAELQMEMGQYDESISNYRKALKIDPYFAASYQGIAINESLKGESDRALEAADQMLAAARNFAERQNALFRSVTSHLFAGDTEKAIEVANVMYSEAQVKGDRAAMGGVQEYLGDIMMASGDGAAALDHFEKALAHRQEADINQANKEQAERTHLFKTAIAAMIADNGQLAVERTTKYEMAAEAVGTAFEKRRVHALNGYLAMYNDDWARAAEHLSMASQLNPIVLYWQAVANKEIGDMERAKELAMRAAHRNTLSANLPFVRSDALQLVEELSSS